MTGSEFLERARALLPVLRERAEQTEQLRRIPDETLKDFHSNGLFRGVQPARYGGYELDPGDFLEAVLEVSSACGSSGCDACDWVFLGGIAPVEGGQIHLTTFLIPRSDYRIDDNWHVAGLCGTGSKDIVVEDAFVPEHRTHSLRDAFECNSPGNAVNTAPLYRLPYGVVFPYAIAAPAIGVARGALETYREQTRDRISALGFEKVAENPFSQLRLAEAAAAVDDAADRMRAIFLSNPIQRAFRDVHTMRAHAANNPEAAARIFGRSELGIPDNEMFL